MYDASSGIGLAGMLKRPVSRSVVVSQKLAPNWNHCFRLGCGTFFLNSASQCSIHPLSVLYLLLVTGLERTGVPNARLIASFSNRCNISSFNADAVLLVCSTP